MSAHPAARRFRRRGTALPALRPQKSKTRVLLTLAAGTVLAREVRKHCRSRQPVAVSRQLAGLAPPGQRYGYDEIVWVGLAHYQRHLQREEIRAALARQGLALSAGSVSALCDRGRRTGRGYRPDARPASASYLISITCTVSNSNMTKSGEDQQVKQIHVADEIERRDDPVPTVILERDGVQYRVFFVVAPDDLCYYFHQPLRRAGD